MAIGIVGCGTIGTALARAIDEGRIPALLSGLANRTQARAEALARSLREEWFREAEARGCRILIASGAIAGLDGVRGAAVGRVDSVTLTTRKPPKSLAGDGPDQTLVRIIAVPGGRFNRHRIEVRGEFGRLTVEIESVPSAMNPRTGLLSIYLSIAFLADYARTANRRNRGST